MRYVSSSNDHKACVRCHDDKHIPKLYSSDNNMDLGPISHTLIVSYYGIYSLFPYLKLIPTSVSIDTICRDCHRYRSFLYQLSCVSHGQYGYSGRVVNLYQDVLSFSSSLIFRLYKFNYCTFLRL